MLISPLSASPLPRLTQLLLQNRQEWEWIQQYLDFYAFNSSNPGLIEGLTKLLALEQDVESMPADLLSAFALENELFAALRGGGVFYDTKRFWCRQCLKVKSNEGLVEQLEWLRKNEPALACQVTKSSSIYGEYSAKKESKYASHDDLDYDVSEFGNMINAELFNTIQHGDVKMEKIQQYIRWGADLESTHTSHRSYLHQAARFNQPKTVEFLLASGAQPNPIAPPGWVPLHNAVNFHGQANASFRETIKLLLQGKADPNARIGGHDSYANRSALDIAIW